MDGETIQLKEGFPKWIPWGPFAACRGIEIRIKCRQRAIHKTKTEE